MGLPAFLAPAALFFLMIFGAYMLWEVWSWFSGNRAELTPGQFRRRLAGGIMLFAAMLMLMMANPWMAGHPARDRLNYLSGIMILTLIPIMLAVREAAFIARQPGPAIDAIRVGPVRLDRNHREAVTLDQPARDRGPGAVEFGGAVAGLAEQDDPRAGETVE